MNGPTPPIRIVEPPGRLLVLLNPGDFTRHYLLQMAFAAERCGIPTDVFELGPVWQLRGTGRRDGSAEFAASLREKRTKAVISSGVNGCWEWPAEGDEDGRAIPFFERMGIPHLMWWTDHPQWANNRAALEPDARALHVSPQQHHFVKSGAAADELHDILGWPNCHGLPVAEDPDRMVPATDVKPEFDVVAIVGVSPEVEPAIDRFLGDDDPDVEAISRMVADRVRQRFSILWQREESPAIRQTLETFGDVWVNARLAEPNTASYRLFKRLEQQHTGATDWLRAHDMTYFDAIEALWELGRWQRTFYLRYLSRFFSVGVFGSYWSGVGIDGVTARIRHDFQPTFYARGRIAINISQGSDEEGVSHKPFQIAASGVPMVHINRTGLADCFTPGVEVESFDTPRQARDKIAALLADPDRRAAMATAARERLCQEHTWDHRLPRMLAAAGVHFPGVVSSVVQTASMPAASVAVHGSAPVVSTDPIAAHPIPSDPRLSGPSRLPRVTQRAGHGRRDSE